MKMRPLKRAATEYCLPVFITLAIVFGGASHYGQTIHLWVQLAAVGLLLTFVRQANHSKWPPSLISLTLLAVMLAVWTVLQLIPVSDAVWQSFGDRTLILSGYQQLGFTTPPDLPVSLAPEKSFAALFGFLPPLAVIVIASAVGWRMGLSKLQWLIPMIGAFSALIGLAQIFLGPDSALYFYTHTNRRFPVGVFSNANHQATLMLMCLPFVAALAGKLRQQWLSIDEHMGKAIAIGLLFLLNLVGLLAAGSVAGYALLIPVLLLSLLLIGNGRKTQSRRVTGGLILVSTLLCAILVALSPNLDGLGATSFEDHETSRIGIWRVTQSIGKDHGILGVGPGAYEDVYRLYENPETVTSRYVNHAHNDYLQVWVEWGIPGLVLVALALLVWIMAFIRIWTHQPDKFYRYRRAASIALFVVIAHSLVDYPARTPAIATLSAACLAIMLLPRRSSQEHSSSDHAARAADAEKRVTL